MVVGLFKYCRGERTRTSGLVVPNDARYRAALHPELRTHKNNDLFKSDIGNQPYFKLVTAYVKLSG